MSSIASIMLIKKKEKKLMKVKMNRYEGTLQSTMKIKKNKNVFYTCNLEKTFGINKNHVLVKVGNNI